MAMIMTAFLEGLFMEQGIVWPEQGLGYDREAF